MLEEYFQFDSVHALKRNNAIINKEKVQTEKKKNKSKNNTHK